jgi:hypothetical protein
MYTLRELCYNMFMLKCRKCSVDKPETDFYIDRRRNRPLTMCKSCYTVYRRERRAKYPEVENHSRIKRDYRNKLLVMSHYSGGKCACCGEDKLEFLAIDHIDNNGNEERNKLGISGNMFYRWLIKNDFPSGYQVLCHNCNQAKGSFGVCPHQSQTDFSRIGGT